MTAPFIVIQTHAIEEGKLQGLREIVRKLAENLETSEPQLLAVNAYPDAASLQDRHVRAAA